ncbi:unnamed protein product, partial [Scytosiphon promiscuus]
MTNPRRTAHGLVNLHPTVFDRVKIVKYIAPYYDASGTLLAEIRSHLRPPSYTPVSRHLVRGHGHARSVECSTLNRVTNLNPRVGRVGSALTGHKSGKTVANSTSAFYCQERGPGRRAFTHMQLSPVSRVVVLK